VWSYAERKVGFRVDDRSTWGDGRLRHSWKGLRRNPAFAPLVDNPSVQAALKAIFGPAGWRPPKPGAQVLLSLPGPGPWVLPDAWHMDCGFERPTWPVFAVKLFAFFDDVEPGGGGTMLLPGSHRVVDRYRRSLPPGTGGGQTHWRPFMKNDPWLAELLRGARLDDGGRSLVGQRHDVDGIPVELLELAGRPGDVVITHLHVFHTASPNVGDRPRQMLGKGIEATGATPPAPTRSPRAEAT
ncbi:MAG: phytanoyl-CoA dioxygenase family protein, partial [Actinomycetota bacterium]|nr:phytanoyl-CoA dioxygenase family protein [Actinomycetota bacterium]